MCLHFHQRQNKSTAKFEIKLFLKKVSLRSRGRVNETCSQLSKTVPDRILQKQTKLNKKHHFGLKENV